MIEPAGDSFDHSVGKQGVSRDDHAQSTPEAGDLVRAYRMWRPPAATAEVARWTIDEPRHLRPLRAALLVAVADGIPEGVGDHTDLDERLTVVASELAGNALRHGRPPTVVTLRRVRRLLIIDVRDNDPDGRPTVDERRASGAGGLGLALVERLAQEVGWYRTDTGKHVWAVFTWTS
jgi:serine/threonine-protein kinase RsbW